MRKHYLYSTLVCALSAISLSFNIAPAIGKQTSSAKKRSVWVAVTKIRKGEKIQKRMIVEELIPERDYPNFAVEFSWLIVGKRPSHDIPPTKIIQESDFFDLAGIKVPSVYTTKEIPAGSYIKKSDLVVVISVFYSRVPQFPPRPTNLSAVVGKKARTSLAASHELINSDIIP